MKLILSKIYIQFVVLEDYLYWKIVLTDQLLVVNFFKVCLTPYARHSGNHQSNIFVHKALFEIWIEDEEVFTFLNNAFASQLPDAFF